MVWLIIAGVGMLVILAGFVCIVLQHKVKNPTIRGFMISADETLVEIGVVISVLSLFVCFLFTIPAVFSMALPKYGGEVILYETKNLAPLTNAEIENQDEGTYFLEFDRASKKCFYMTEENDVFSSESVYLDDVNVKYLTDDSEPYVERYIHYEEDSSSDFRFWFSFILFDNSEKRYETAYYIFYIPQGSVITDYNINSE